MTAKDIWASSIVSRLNIQQVAISFSLLFCYSTVRNRPGYLTEIRIRLRNKILPSFAFPTQMSAIYIKMWGRIHMLHGFFLEPLPLQCITTSLLIQIRNIAGKEDFELDLPVPLLLKGKYWDIVSCYLYVQHETLSVTQIDLYWAGGRIHALYGSSLLASHSPNFTP